jgi:Phosphatidylinositol 3- and 4-kinase
MFDFQSRHDDDFCQRLHFVLRSYTATLEGLRTKDDSTSNLLTLLQALDRLRVAQRQLASQLTNDTSRVRVSSIDKNDVENALKSDSDDSMLIAIGPSSSSVNGNTHELLPKKSKSVFKMFHKRNKDFACSSESKSAPLRARHSVPDLVAMNDRSIAIAPAAIKTRTKSLTNLAVHLEYFSVPSLLENMTRFLTELDGICDTIERSLLKSISQKIADWALQPWSASKESELAKVTEGMREGLKSIMASGNAPSPLVNPVQTGELLVSVDSNGCYILPSAHFPLLLTFNVDSKPRDRAADPTRPSSFLREEQLYRTKVEIVAIRGSASPMKAYKNGTSDGNDRMVRSYVVQAAVAGNIQETGRSVSLDEKSKVHSWEKDGILTFDTRSHWGAPQTLSLGVSAITIGDDGHDQVVRSDEKGKLHYTTDVGHCWVDMKPLWERIAKSGVSNGSNKPVALTVSCHAQVWSLENTEPFDQHGELINGMSPVPERLELELRVTNELLMFEQAHSGYQSRKRMLLYKHDDDLRQEMFAIQFINICDLLLKASGLDLKLLTFRCIPVGFKRGFIEWIPGSVPLSDICQPFGGVVLMKSPSDESENRREGKISEREDPLSGVAKAGLFKYQSLPRSPTNQTAPFMGRDRENSLTNNPIQDFFRSTAYDPDAPYFIQRELMENYVKSCAGYCVITYLLGVGDRHLDNLLLHQSGHFFHCDYSFILGNDPKKYLPMRITEHMIQGMGGRESDNYARFLSLAGATFIALRRHENVRVILSMVRLMVPSVLPDVSVNQNPHEALHGILERLHLDLSDEKAISYMEQLIEESVCSKLWIAVDAMHSIGKRF